jgi:hypothetical protein
VTRPLVSTGGTVTDISGGTLLSLNVGLPRDVEWDGRTVHTGIWKHPVEGRRVVRHLNVDGDGQGDREGHGGVNRAVFVYQIGSYRYWQELLGRDDLTFGQFGENFTVDGLADDEVCIGDRYRIGSAVFEVSQPRVTATGSASGWMSRACPRCWSPIAGRASTSASSRRGRSARATASS